MKSILVVKEETIEEVRVLFADLQIDIVLASCFVGGSIGDEEGVHLCMQQGGRLG